MKFMMIVKANQASEAGELPDAELLAARRKYTEELVNAGVLLAGDGLHPSAKGARVKFVGDQRLVTDGPFIETKELIAGYWLGQMNSLAEAIEWVKRAPNLLGDQGEIEIRQVAEMHDFGEAMTPELREQEERVFAQAEKLLKHRTEGGTV